MTMELARGRFGPSEEPQHGWGLAELAPIGRLGIVLLLVGWSWFLVEPLLSQAIGGQLIGLLGRIGQSALVTGAALTVMGYLLGQSSGLQRAAKLRQTDEVERVAEPAVEQRARPPIGSAPAPAPTPTAAPPGTMVVVARGQVDDRGFLVLADGFGRHRDAARPTAFQDDRGRARLHRRRQVRIARHRADHFESTELRQRQS